MTTCRRLCASNAGRVSEWPKEHAWKACVRATVPWVRIPSLPPEERRSDFVVWPFLFSQKSERFEHLGSGEAFGQSENYPVPFIRILLDVLGPIDVVPEVVRADLAQLAAVYVAIIYRFVDLFGYFRIFGEVADDDIHPSMTIRTTIIVS